MESIFRCNERVVILRSTSQLLLRERQPSESDEAYARRLYRLARQIEKRVNNATAKIFDELEIDSGKQPPAAD